MSRASWTWAGLGVLAVGLVVAGGARAGGPDDDLSVVKRAVETPASPAAQGPAAPAPPGTKPQWLRVRIVDRGTRKARVTVNLPLAIVHVFDDDFPISWQCRKEGHETCRLKLGEILKSLQAGQQIVEVDEEQTTIRVWVD